MFILTDQIDEPGAFLRYREYLRQNRAPFPPRAYTLATSEWYYASTDPRCPHDARMEALTLAEADSETQQERHLTLRVRLFGGHRNGYVELFYPRVFAYRLDTEDGGQGHRDWRYDEFRVTESGHLLHEIEWWGWGQTGRWLIEASDVEFVWQPGE